MVVLDVKLKQEETYDPLCQVQKIFLLKNGQLDIPGIKINNSLCARCSHSGGDHLDGHDICLQGLCICDQFIESWPQLTERTKTTKGKEKKNLEIPEEDQRVSVYLQSLAKL